MSQKAFLRSATLLLLSSTMALKPVERRRHSELTTVIVGVIRTAVTRTPIANSIIYIDVANDSTRSDSLGRFTLKVPRLARLLGVRKTGLLEFQYPVLNLTTDTLRVDIEMRADPPASLSYVPNTHFLPFLCIVLDSPAQLSVTNGCGNFSHPLAEYSRQIIKHNPWSLYFGPAGDNGGVLIATRAAAGALQ